MNDARKTAHFYCLSDAGEFELHTDAGDVVRGKIADDLVVDDLQQFDGTGVLCSCIVRGTPPVLLSIGTTQRHER